MKPHEFTNALLVLVGIGGAIVMIGSAIEIVCLWWQNRRDKRDPPC